MIIQDHTWHHAHGGISQYMALHDSSKRILEAIGSKTHGILDNNIVLHSIELMQKLPVL